MKLESLPEDCFAQILSLTSPQDACCVSGTSSVLRILIDSDSVWEKFLPSDCTRIISGLVSPWNGGTKKELFFRLCSPQFIDNGRKMISVDKSTGKIVYKLSSRELCIAWASNPLYWSWKSYVHSRFSEVAELRTICWLQINGKFNTQKLSPKTEYGAYLIVKFAGRSYGLDTLPSEIFLSVGKSTLQSYVFLRRPRGKAGKWGGKAGNLNVMEDSGVKEREDGWVEIELGSFYNGGGGGEEVEMGLKEVTGEHLKGGLIVDGIEIRPIH